MADSILFDTDILIDIGRNIEPAVSILKEKECESVVSISIITQMELIIGCRNKAELANLDSFLERFEIVSLIDSYARKGVKLLKQYRHSHGLLIADALIAATAIEKNMVLLSKNQKDYRYIKELQLIPYPVGGMETP